MLLLKCSSRASECICLGLLLPLPVGPVPVLSRTVSASLALCPVAEPLVDCCRRPPALAPLLLWACCGLSPLVTNAQPAPRPVRSASAQGELVACVRGRTPGPAVCGEGQRQVSRTRAARARASPFAYSGGREQGPEGRRPAGSGVWAT